MKLYIFKINRTEHERKYVYKCYRFILCVECISHLVFILEVKIVTYFRILHLHSFLKLYISYRIYEQKIKTAKWPSFAALQKSIGLLKFS